MSEGKILAPASKTVSQFSLVITGDMSFGENYQIREEQRGRGNILKSRGYAYTMEKIAPLLSKSDLTLANLETVVTDNPVSPFAQTKGYVHWSDIRETPKQLLAHNIRAVSLANNHCIDFGEPGLIQTLQVLADAGIAAFGAGGNLDAARLPLDHTVNLEAATGETKPLHVRVYAAFAVDGKYRNEFRAYAESSKPGTNPLLLDELVEEISLTKSTYPNCFVIAVLHWRRDYRWRSARQVEAAQRLLRAGADLLIGHGSHMMQEIEKIDGRWVAHGLGNFVFNSPGRYRHMNAPPYSLVARLIFEADKPRPRLLLYPLLTDNLMTGYQTRFVSSSEFTEVMDILRKRTSDVVLFDREIGTGCDEFGNFIEMPCPSLQRTELTGTTRSPADAPAFVTESWIDLKSTRVFVGPNIYIDKPAVRFDVEIGNPDALLSQNGVDFLTAVLPDLSQTLLAANPLSQDVRQWLGAASVAETAAISVLTLMRRVDERISQVVTGKLDTGSGFYLVCEYERSAANAKHAVGLAIRVLQMAMRGAADRQQFDHDLAKFETLGRRRGRPPINTLFILQEAEARNIPIRRSGPGPMMLGHGRFQKRLDQTFTTGTGILAVQMCKDKNVTATILAEAGLPVPSQRIVLSLDQAVAAANDIGYPVVVKPARGNRGQGISGAVTTTQTLKTAYAEAIKINDTVIVEKFIAGSDFRLLVVDYEFVAASRRVFGHVIGDGKTTVAGLIDILNADPRRQDNWDLDKLEIDYDAERLLAVQGMDLASIPQAGQHVSLRSRGDVTASTIAVTQLVHPDNRRLAVAAARALQLNIAGIDFLTSDISRSYKEVGGAICEVNSYPAIDLHAKPTSGAPVNVASHILDMLFPARANGRIPTIAICGGQEASRLAKATAHFLQMAGYDTGVATQYGVWIAGDQLSTGDFANPTGARQVLLNPGVDAAVLQTSTRSILQHGLGFDQCDVLLVTGLPKDLADESHEIAAIAAVMRSARAATIFGTSRKIPPALLAADRDRMVHSIAPQSQTEPQSKIGICNNTLTLASGGISENLRLPSIPWFSTSELAMAAAACRTAGIRSDLISDGLKTLVVELSGNLLLSRLESSIGPLLLATPRNRYELEAICAIARAWAAPQKPDIYVQMAFTGDSELLAALTAETEIGFATRFQLTENGEARQLSDFSFASKDPSSKLLIVTDNIEFFRRILSGDSPNPRSHHPAATAHIKHRAALTAKIPAEFL